MIHSLLWFPKGYWIRYSIQAITIGWPKSKVANSNGYNYENMHIWSQVGKTKMCFACPSLFGFFSCLFTIFSCLFTISRNKLGHTKHILALTIWVKNAYFQTFITKWKFSNFEAQDFSDVFTIWIDKINDFFYRNTTK